MSIIDDPALKADRRAILDSALRQAPDGDFRVWLVEAARMVIERNGDPAHAEALQAAKTAWDRRQSYPRGDWKETRSLKADVEN